MLVGLPKLPMYVEYDGGTMASPYDSRAVFLFPVKQYAVAVIGGGLWVRSEEHFPPLVSFGVSDTHYGSKPIVVILVPSC